MVGQAIASRYRIERALGEGGMGRVYEAVDLQLGRHVAIKVIRDELDDPATRSRFFREARAAAALSHPHACQLYEVSPEDEAQPYLVMELLEGQPLSKRLDQGPLDTGEVAAILLPLMTAIEALHRAGLVHRDLKPDNIFLTEQGVKLLDFGLARHAQRPDAMTASLLTVPGAVTGTMRHMAPEQVTGDPVDARTDIFALGVILYEMLTGRVPFDADTNAEWLNAMLTADPPSLGIAGLQEVDAVITRALQRRPEDRFDTVEAMAAALEAALMPADGVAATSTAPAPADATSLAVLPFRLLQDDTDLAALKDGVPDALTARLSPRADLRIVSNRLAQEFDESSDLVAAGRALKVERLLTGSLLRGGETLRVTVQLISARDGAVEWSQTSQHEVDDVLTMQDEICQRIVAELPLRDHATAR